MKTISILIALIVFNVTACDPVFAGKLYGSPVDRAVVVAAKKDLGRSLGIDARKIKRFGYNVTYARIPAMQNFYLIGLVYKGETYLYRGHAKYKYDRHGRPIDVKVSVMFTGRIIPTAYDEEGNLILDPAQIKNNGKSDLIKERSVAETDPEALIEDKAIDKSLDERKDIESQVELKGDRKNYTVSGQMAEKSQEAILLPLKK